MKSRKFIGPRVAAFVADMDAVFVEHREFTKAFKAIGVSIETCGLRKQPMCVHVSGPTGVGKSTLRAKLAQIFLEDEDGAEVIDPPYPTMTANYVPLLQLELPVQPTVRKTIQAMLRVFGDPRATERDHVVIEARLFRFIAACGCFGILLDEAQRLIDAHGEVLAQDLLDWFKDLAEKTGVSIVLLGVGRLKHVFSSDDQIRRRWANAVEFRPYTWPDTEKHPINHPEFAFTEDQEVLFGVFKAMEELMPLYMHPDASVLNVNHEISYYNMRRFYYSCRGTVGLHKKLLLACMELAEGYEAVTMDLLEKAYAAAFRTEEESLVNPFGQDWHGQLPPPLMDHTLLLRPKRKRSPKTKKQKQRELADALTK